MGYKNFKNRNPLTWHGKDREHIGEPCFVPTKKSLETEPLVFKK